MIRAHTLSIESIGRWTLQTRDVPLPLGPPPEEVTRRAQEFLRRLDSGECEPVTAELRSDVEAPDVLYAMCAILQPTGELGSETGYGRVVRVYEVASQMQWEDEFGEQSAVVGQLALVGWRHSRRFRTYRETKKWEARCAREVVSQAHNNDFLSLASADRSDAVLRRFFSDTSIVLAQCASLEAKRNDRFDWVATEATAVFEALGRLQLPADDEERAFFRADLALSTAVAIKHLGMFRESEKWLARARKALGEVRRPAPYEAIASFVELTLAYDRHDPRTVLKRVEAIYERLAAEGVDFHAVSARLMRAGALKDLGLFRDSAVEYQQISSSLTAASEPLLLGIALLNRAEVEGQLSAGFDLAWFQEARAVLQTQSASWPLAHLQASIGEYLRDRGKLLEAVEAYRSSVRSYEELSMKTRVAYIRLLLAETLIATGQEAEAVYEISQALKVSEAEGVDPHIRAGVALLNEAFRRGAVGGSVWNERLKLIRQIADKGRPCG